MEEIETTMVCIHGDNHGDWNKLFTQIDDLNIKECVLIGVGDTGVGFKSKDVQTRVFNILNNRFEERGIKYMSIRGNHCAPSYFQGDVKMSHFELLPDYTYRRINNEVFLLVGGAISIDRQYRVQGQSYWKDESFVFKPELVKKSDVVITHTPPYWLGPFDKDGLESWCVKDTSLWDECLKERIEISALIKLANPTRSYHGHMHVSAHTNNFNCHSTILDIDEITQHRPY
jgi:hypothetical protein